ncbi:hypothetical protein [Streptococcus halichoeri]|uniref:hypothetical protein n=1 Tax=Streptococcus halichoeri TaxID=254785 RepID=UPI00135B1E24|nr:hypothetical protein [Streptococcus halichoeri]
MSTREQAMLYWVFILLVFSIVFGRKYKLGNNLMGIMKAAIALLLNPITLVMVVINSVYIIIMYYFAYKTNQQISLWHIKDYLIVLFFSVLPILATLKKMKISKLIHARKTEFLSLATVLSFISSNYTLPVIWEIILVFSLTFLSLCIQAANQKEEMRNFAKMFSFLEISIVLFILLFALNQFLKNINDVSSWDFWISFGLELGVWILNIPLINIARKMIFIEKKVIFSNYKNSPYAYVKYYMKLLKRKLHFMEYEHLNHDVSQYIQEAKELSAFGGNRIYIKLSKKDLSALPNEVLIAIVSDAILGKNKFTKINNQRGKYPNVVEIVNKNHELCAFWQDSFIASNYRDTRIDEMKTIELLEGIKIIQE